MKNEPHLKFTQSIKQLTQPLSDACVSTCVAMLSSNRLEDIIQKYHNDYIESDITLYDILDSEDINYIIPQKMDGSIYYGKVYLLTVPSLNLPGIFHQVLADYRDPDNPMIHDPNIGYEGRKYYVSGEPSNEYEVKFSSWFIDAEIID